MSTRLWIALLAHAALLALGVMLRPHVSQTTLLLMVGCGSAIVSVILLQNARWRNAFGMQQLLVRLGKPPQAIGSPEHMARKVGNRADELLAASVRMELERERLAAILSAMTEGVIAIDSDERIQSANRASYAAMDSDPAEPVGRPFRELVRSSQIHDYVSAILNGESLDPIECELSRTNKIVAVKADLIGSDGLKGAVLTIFDITELRRLERIRREFVANVSHELKTPLTVIQACADTLADGAISDSGHAPKFLSRIDEQCQRLGELINDMLDLGRIESSPELLEWQPVNLQRVLRDCVAQRENIAATKQLSLTVELAETDMTIDSDPTSLRTLVENLADNAIKYTLPGGRVTLKLDREHDTAVIRVQDTGIGIDRQHIKRIFQRFYRVDSARSRVTGGSGLGLAICKHLAQQLNGTIDVESEPGAGSTFTVRLPISAAGSQIS